MIDVQPVHSDDGTMRLYVTIFGAEVEGFKRIRLPTADFLEDWFAHPMLIAVYAASVGRRNVETCRVQCSVAPAHRLEAITYVTEKAHALGAYLLLMRAGD